MGNSESFREPSSASTSPITKGLTQSVIVQSTHHLKRDPQRTYYRNTNRRRSSSDYTEMSAKRMMSNWRSSQRKNKMAQMSAMEKERRAAQERDELFSAIISGDIEAVSRMLSRGVNVNASDENHLTALHHAAIHTKPEIISMLIENGANVNAYDMKGGFTPVHWVVINNRPGMGDFETVDRCLEALVRGGCNINCKDFNQATPLHFAARKDDKMMVDSLMRLGADPNQIDVLGRTCASVAKSEDTKILIIKLADLKARAYYHVLDIPPSF